MMARHGRRPGGHCAQTRGGAARGSAVLRARLCGNAGMKCFAGPRLTLVREHAGGAFATASLAREGA